ncbi:MAG: hypothetical protein EPN40_04920 [Rhodanobacteraceae bacterium]|nr:MAG: hypothetical protein EPN40_04920 [Rhodanobacteraceae bacterium]
MNARHVDFPDHGGSRPAARLDLPSTPLRAYALFAHCFSCSKDVLAASRIIAALIVQGTAVLRFDFTGLGMSECEFVNTHFSSNVADSLRAADSLRDRHQVPMLLVGRNPGGATVPAAARNALAPGRVHVVESGASRHTQLVRADRHDLIADEPVSVGGDDAGSGPGPFDSLPVSLGTFTTMTLRVVAERRGWKLDPVEVTLGHHHIHAQDCADCGSSEDKVLEIERTIRSPGSIDTSIAQQLLNIADRCPGASRAQRGVKVHLHVVADDVPGAPIPAAPHTSQWPATRRNPCVPCGGTT